MLAFLQKLKTTLIDDLPLTERDKPIYEEWLRRGRFIPQPWYNDVYLKKTDHWANVRKRVSELWDYRCSICYSNKEPLDVHHRDRKYKCLWFEKWNDVIYPCRFHHKNNHDFRTGKEFDDALIGLINEVENILAKIHNERIFQWEKMFWATQYGIQEFVDMVYERISDFVDPIPIITEEPSEMDKLEKEINAKFPNLKDYMSPAQREIKNECPRFEPFSKSQNLKMKIVQEFCQRKYANS